MPKVLIIGAGPCGLGAAWRFQELGFDDFLILEASENAGGLASSFVDSEGFTWDIGGHVQFSHYEDFDRVMDEALPDGWLHHQRESWVWIMDRFVPYPFQNNLWRLPAKERALCIQGLEELKSASKAPENFGEWIDQSFGRGIAEIFMRPYNTKVWAYPPETMSYQWIGERVAVVDLQKVKSNIDSQKDEVSWGPNVTFRFPKKGGTGAVWKALSKKISAEKIIYNESVSSISPKEKKLKTAGGNSFEYENLLSTMPLNKLCQLSGVAFDQPLLSSNSHIFGIGLQGKVPEHLKTKCWIYFPEGNCPFYRVTVFSNYSPANVPDATNTWSLMAEVSSSPRKNVDETQLMDQVIEGLIQTKLISRRTKILSRWQFKASPGYPTPTPNRDKIIEAALHELKKFQIFSRGRFGAWKYEVSNQDHTFMQGYEWADWVVNAADEKTLFDPNATNAPGKRAARLRKEAS